MTITSSGQPIDKQLVLAKAFFKVTEQLNFTQTQIATILGISEQATNKLKLECQIDPTSQQGAIALSIIHLFKSLYILSGSDLDWIRHFLNSNNQVIGGIPIKKIETPQGLAKVIQFIETIKH